MAVVEGGKRALTHYRLEAAAGGLASRLKLVLGTGRTHQIRVHLGVLGLGIVGDPIYRPRRRISPSPALAEHLAGFRRLALHAERLGFEHPITGAKVLWSARRRPASTGCSNPCSWNSQIYRTLTIDPVSSADPSRSHAVARGFRRSP